MCGSGGPGALAAGGWEQTGGTWKGPGGHPGAEWRALRTVLEEPVPGARDEASAPSVGSPAARGGLLGVGGGASGSLWALRVASGPQGRAQPSGLVLRGSPGVAGGRGAAGHTPARRPEAGTSALQVGVQPALHLCACVVEPDWHRSFWNESSCLILTCFTCFFPRESYFKKKKKEKSVLYDHDYIPCIIDSVSDGKEVPFASALLRPRSAAYLCGVLRNTWTTRVNCWGPSRGLARGPARERFRASRTEEYASAALTSRRTGSWSLCSRAGLCCFP